MATIVGRFTGFSILSAVSPNICIIFLPGAIFFLISQIGRFFGAFLFWKSFIAIGLEWLLFSGAVCFPLSDIPTLVRPSATRITPP